MAGSVNRVTLLGNVGKDPEIRSTQGGKKIASFSLATSEAWNDRQSGEKRERVEWHRVVVFNDRLADVVERFVQKGKQVYIEGQLKTRKWTDQSGQDRYTTEIVLDQFRGELVLLGGREGGSSSQDRGGYSGQSSRPAQQAARPRDERGGWDQPGSSDLDDEVPF